MDSKVDGEVVIGGKVYTICGYENEEYFQKIAAYINSKLNEFHSSDAMKTLNQDYRNILMQINIADDYFKAKKQIQLMEEEMRAREKEIYDLKHELISNQIKLENSEKTSKKLTEKIADKEKEIITLQAKLDVHKSEKQK
ncbi:MAG: cell division protein ZapA [Lachnospiraceae bacterium]|jgi:cell division protein ZapA|nr:cell division protein ZapA [Lachnospiraceae bacterium]